MNFDFMLYTFCSVCVCQRPDEEVVVDQGGTSSVMNIHYEKEELEGENYLHLENCIEMSGGHLFLGVCIGFSLWFIWQIVL